MRANWKVIVENYNECYHCAGVHPELCRIVPAFREKGGAYLDWDNGVPQAEGTFTFTLTGVTDRAPFPGLDEHEQTRHKGELVYPNLMLSLSADHVAAFTLVPRAPDRTLIVVDWLFHPDEIAKPGFDPSDAVDFWDLVNRQDWTVCEGVQDGMTSRRFGFGWYAPMEDMSLDIRRYLAERVGEDAVRVDLGRGTAPAPTEPPPPARPGIGRDPPHRLGRRRRRPRRARLRGGLLGVAPAGVRVLGLEQYELGHSLGASQDVSRIIRLSYHRPDYVRLARRAYATWAEVERESGTQVVFRTGGLDVGPREKDHGVEIDLDAYIDSMRAEDVPFEVLDAAEVMRRFPAWRLGDEHVGLFQPDAGLADPSRGNVAHRRPRVAQARRSATGPASWDRAAATTAPSSSSSRAGSGSPPAGSSSRPTPGPTTCSSRSAPACR